MNLSPSEMSPRRALWMGLVVSIAFRIFAYAIVWIALRLISGRAPFPVQNEFVVLGICAIFMAFPFVVPFVAGYIGGYYWRRVSPHDYTNPIFVTNTTLLVGVLAILRYEFSFEVVVVGILVALFDMVLCVVGGVHGSNFWEGRFARQLVGDFSSPEDDD